MSYFDRKWRLSACREHTGYSQTEVAGLIGVDVATVSAWETGKTTPRIEYAQKLSELYEVPMAYMEFTKEGNSKTFKDSE
jgi:transcriptional regulator with XRE-family HTH domain